MRQVKIIAVDFDGCIVTNEFPNIGQPIQETISALHVETMAGAKIILWTCRVGNQLEEAVNWCNDMGIYLDAVNTNLPEIICEHDGDSRKIFADEYWDDRAVRMPRKDI